MDKSVFQPPENPPSQFPLSDDSRRQCPRISLEISLAVFTLQDRGLTQRPLNKQVSVVTKEPVSTADTKIERG